MSKVIQLGSGRAKIQTQNSDGLLLLPQASMVVLVSQLIMDSFSLRTRTAEPAMKWERERNKINQDGLEQRVSNGIMLQNCLLLQAALLRSFKEKPAPKQDLLPEPKAICLEY